MPCDPAASIREKVGNPRRGSRHQGDYRRILEGVNQTLDAVIGPLNVAANCADKIFLGKILPKITGSYDVELNILKDKDKDKDKDNLNTSLDEVNTLVADIPT